MTASVVDLARGRKGHFRLESGYHGGLWLDLPQMYLQPGRVRPLCEELARRLADVDVDMVCGPLVEGAFVGLIAALELNAEFCFVERASPFPAGTGCSRSSTGSRQHSATPSAASASRSSTT